MAQNYKINSTSIKVFSDPVNTLNIVGQLYKGAEISGTLTGGKIKINKVNNGNNYYKGVVIGGYIENTGVTAIRNKSTNVSNTTPLDTSTDDNTGTIDNTTGDDGLLQVLYEGRMSDSDYTKQLSEGIRITNLRGILGMPHQFLPNTDPRIVADENGSRVKNSEDLGRVYAERIVKRMPLLFLTPGNPSFMTSFDHNQKQTILSKLENFIDEAGFDELINTGSGKLYNLKFAYVEYFKYVNAMLRSAAFFLGIDGVKLDQNGKSLGEINWFYAPYGNDDNNEGATFDNYGLRRVLGTYAGSIPIYAEVESRSTDNFSNSTTQSSLEGAVNGLSDTARELNFYLGNISGALNAGKIYDNLGGAGLTESIESVTGVIDGILGGPNIFTNISNKLSNIIAGGRMSFPEIWSESSFGGRSYNINMKLVSPSGDKLSVFLNILVPIYHLLAFVLPRSSSSQSYYSPFLVKGSYRGMFNIDMGIIIDMSISKGDEGLWTKDNLPTCAEISFTIKDLYDKLYMSKAEITDNYRGIMSNEDELNFIANSAGIVFDEPAVVRTLRMYKTLYLNARISDVFSMDIYGGISQYLNQKVHNIFSSFK